MAEDQEAGNLSMHMSLLEQTDQSDENRISAPVGDRILDQRNPSTCSQALAEITWKDRIKALAFEHTPSPGEMRGLNITYVLLESLVGAYMLLSVLMGNPSENKCVADPARFTAALFYYCFIPFYFLRMLAIVFFKSQKSVIYQLLFIWLGSFIAVCIWEFLAI